jgi:hypothetical protein
MSALGHRVTLTARRSLPASPGSEPSQRKSTLRIGAIRRYSERILDEFQVHKEGAASTKKRCRGLSTTRRMF